MNQNPNLDQVITAAEALESLLDEVVLVGGCAVGLLITDLGSAPVRPTIDVDVIVQVAPLAEYYLFCEKLKSHGFAESTEDGVIFRWKKDAIILDVMPIDESILGFTNSWYKPAMQNPEKFLLSTDLSINLISAPLFVASKLESFASRGGGDYLHHDIEDIISIIDGRDNIVEEISKSDDEVRKYIADEFETLLGDENFSNLLPGHLNSMDAAARVNIVLSRIRQIVGL